MHLCPWGPCTSLEGSCLQTGSCLQNGLAYPTLVNSSLLEVSITCRAIKKGWGKKGKPLWPLGSLSWWAWCHVMLIAGRCWETEDEECLSALRLGLRFQGKLALLAFYSAPLERTISKFRQRGIVSKNKTDVKAHGGQGLGVLWVYVLRGAVHGCRPHISEKTANMGNPNIQPSCTQSHHHSNSTEDSHPPPLPS